MHIMATETMSYVVYQGDSVEALNELLREGWHIHSSNVLPGYHYGSNSAIRGEVHYILKRFIKTGDF
jgi:hypothetical protein